MYSASETEEIISQDDVVDIDPSNVKERTFIEALEYGQIRIELIIGLVDPEKP